MARLLIARSHGRPIGLELRLGLGFIAVALGAIWAVTLIVAVIASGQLKALVGGQEANIAEATALTLSDTHPRVGWSRADLRPVIDLTGKEGVAVQVKDPTGRLIGSSPGFSSFPARAERTEPIVAAGRNVGSVTIKFGGRDLGGAINHFDSARRQDRFAMAAIGSVVAILLAALAAHWISQPLDLLASTVRARGSGDHDARAGDVRGFRKVRELATAFDQMADSLDAEGRVRRNLVADIAHDLRTPITVMQATGEAMLDGTLALTPENLESSHGELARLRRMVDDLQRLASAEAATLQLTVALHDLAAVAASVARNLAEVFGAANVILVQELSPVLVMCDPRRVEEVVTNLLTNAVKFTPAGGVVTLETGPSGQLAILRVSDTGVGISPEDLPHVRERFYRGQRSGEVAGSGIGLAIVDELVRAQRGTFDISSELDVGTRATITFPRLDGPE